MLESPRRRPLPTGTSFTGGCERLALELPPLPRPRVQHQLIHKPQEISLYENVMKIIQLIYFNNPASGPLRAADSVIIFKILAVISDQS